MRKLVNELSYPHLILIAFITVSLLLGIIFVPDFGVSIDEGAEFRRSSLSLKIYTNQLTEAPLVAFNDTDENEKYYGTAVTILARIAETTLFPNMDHQTFVVAHYIYFLSFLAAVVGIYLLSRQFVSDWASLFVALFFGTQPLLVGHAFINPKDTPLLAVFMLAVVTGFRMVDHWTEHAPESRPGGSPRGWLPLLGGLAVLLWSSPLVIRLVQDAITAGYQAQGQGILGTLFARLTQSGLLEDYLVAAHLRMLQFYKWAAIAGSVLVVVLALRHHRKAGPQTISVLPMLLAGLVWGIAISTRTIALAAGGIVGLYALFRFGRQAIRPLLGYTLLAAIFSYLTWPFLWAYGIGGLIKSFTFWADHVWVGQILFDGLRYPENQLPWYYLPKLLRIQFTVPLVLLAIGGIVLTVVFLSRRRPDAPRFALMLAWLLLPVLYVIAARPTMYNNFRQFLFITPPLFIYAGVAFEEILERIRHRSVAVLFALLMIVPGPVGIVDLHPLQYSFFNQFVGGFESAVQSYETDYWDVGWAVLDDLVEETIPEGSSVMIWRDRDFANRYFEEEFPLEIYRAGSELNFSTNEYAIVRYHHYQVRQSLQGYTKLAVLDVGGIPIYTIYKNQD
jgi:hypothetical protein